MHAPKVTARSFSMWPGPKWQDTNTASEADTLRTALCKSETIVSIVCLSDILSLTHPLSKYLQTTNIDLKTVKNTLDNT